MRLLVWFLGLGFGVAFGVPRSTLNTWITAEEQYHRLPEGLLHAIIEQESSYRIDALNPATRDGTKVSSYGLGQLTKATAKFHCGLPFSKIFYPVENIECSAKVLRYQLDRYKGNIRKAVAAYNWGTPCVCDGDVYKQRLKRRTRVCRNKKGLPLVCQIKGSFFNKDYVEGVMSRYARLRDQPTLKPAFHRIRQEPSLLY